MGTIPEQNSKMPPTTSSISSDENVTSPKTVNDYGETPKNLELATPHTFATVRHPINTSNGCTTYLEIPLTNWLPPKLTENDEVLHHLNDDTKPLPSIKLKKPLKINDLMNAFLQYSWFLALSGENSGTLFKNLHPRLPHCYFQLSNIVH